jgi:hypothetical protein
MQPPALTSTNPHKDMVRMKKKTKGEINRKTSCLEIFAFCLFKGVPGSKPCRLMQHE